MSVSRWERGVQEPSSHIFVRLGSLSSSDELRWEFWERAGLTRDQVVSSAASETPLPDVGNLVEVPLLDVRLGASLIHDFVTNAVPMEMLAAPLDWCPHPDHTLCAFVEGDSMEPVIRDGSVACFDTADNKAEALENKIVVAQHPHRGTKLAWLERHDGRLAFRSEDPKVPIVPLDDEWKIIGRLLWWLTRT